jgi:hypothetical protein
MVRGSNPGGGKIFRTRPDRPWGPPSLLYDGYRVFRGGKAAGAWRWPPTTSSAEVKERVGLYLHSPSGPLWPVIGWPLPLPCIFYYFVPWPINAQLYFRIKINGNNRKKRQLCIGWSKHKIKKKKLQYNIIFLLHYGNNTNWYSVMWQKPRCSGSLRSE